MTDAKISNITKPTFHLEFKGELLFFLLLSHLFVIVPGNERLLRLFVPIGVSGNLSEESQRERASAGVTVLTKEEDKLLSELNAKYKTAFGFPFIICARENKKESILQSLQRRLKNSQKSEAMIGLIEVKKICKLRIQDLVSENVLSKL